MVDWIKDNGGWQTPQIVPYGPFQIDTSATCLHYGISAYEGFSVFQNAETGAPLAFRARDNLKSFLLASDHLDLPQFDIDELLACLKKLILLDKAWFPEAPYFSKLVSQLYLRLAHISIDA